MSTTIASAARARVSGPAAVDALVADCAPDLPQRKPRRSSTSHPRRMIRLGSPVRSQQRFPRPSCSGVPQPES